MTTWNRLWATKKSLPALLELTQSDGTFDIKFTVVDDFSDDGTQKWLVDFWHENNESFSLVLLKERSGVNFASNLGWQMYCGHYVKFDNNVLVKDPRWLVDLVFAAEGLGENVVGVIGYNLEFRSYKSTFIRGFEVIDKTNSNVGGKCVLVPSWTSKRIGLWNENIGTLYRGADYLYGLRVRSIGLKSLYLVNSSTPVVRINGNETQDRVSFRNRMKKESRKGVHRLEEGYLSGNLPLDFWCELC